MCRSASAEPAELLNSTTRSLLAATLYFAAVEVANARESVGSHELDKRTSLDSGKCLERDANLERGISTLVNP